MDYRIFDTDESTQKKKKKKMLPPVCTTKLWLSNVPNAIFVLKCKSRGLHLPPRQERGCYSDGRLRAVPSKRPVRQPQVASPSIVLPAERRTRPGGWQNWRRTVNVHTNTCGHDGGSCDHNRDCCCTSAERQPIFHDNVVLFLSLFQPSRHLNLRRGNESK